jgi:amidase
MSEDDVGAFVPGQRFRVEARPDGPLAGLTFAAKDLFDVAGRPTGAGNPDKWSFIWPEARRIELLRGL